VKIVYTTVTANKTVSQTSEMKRCRDDWHTSGISSVNRGYNFSCARSRTPRHRAAS